MIWKQHIPYFSAGYIWFLSLATRSANVREKTKNFLCTFVSVMPHCLTEQILKLMVTYWILLVAKGNFQSDQSSIQTNVSLAKPSGKHIMNACSLIFLLATVRRLRCPFFPVHIMPPGKKPQLRWSLAIPFCILLAQLYPTPRNWESFCNALRGTGEETNN